MRTFLYIFAVCLATISLFLTVNSLERNRPLAILLMILILGLAAAAILNQLMPGPGEGYGSINFSPTLRGTNCPPQANEFWGAGTPGKQERMVYASRSPPQSNQEWHSVIRRLCT
jgi:hypothetical protein